MTQGDILHMNYIIKKYYITDYNCIANCNFSITVCI